MRNCNEKINLIYREKKSSHDNKYVLDLIQFKCQSYQWKLFSRLEYHNLHHIH